MTQRLSVSPKTLIVLLIYLLSSSVLELLAYRHGGIFSISAAWLWVLSGILCLGMFCISAISHLKNDLKERRYFLLAAYLFLLGLFCFFIGNLSFSDISYESALQTAAGLSSFSEPDLNYTGVAFLNYANRQYVINALPSFFFGRSVLTLHLGYALPFLIGMTLWYLELRQWLKTKNLKEEIALLPVYALATFPFITEYFMNFEQTLTPISYTMMGLALLLRFYRTLDAIGIVALSFVGGMCCNSYTPVLAFFGFLVVFVALRGAKTLWKSYKESLPLSQEIIWELLLCFGLFTQLVSYFVATLVTPQKSMISTVNQKVSLFEALVTSWFDFFSDTQATFFGIWLGAILLYLFFCCLGLLRFYDFLIAGWMLLTVFFSSYMTGYTSYAKCHEIQRNMLIIPVFLTALFFLLVRFLTRLQKYKVNQTLLNRLKKRFLPLTLLFFLLLGAFHFTQPHHSFLYYGYVQPIKYLFNYAEEILTEHKIADTDEFNLVFLTDNKLQSNLADYCAYFYPNAHTFVAGVTEFPPEIDNSLPTFVFSESATTPTAHLKLANTKSWNNLRYRKEITLYLMKGTETSP